MPNVVRWDRAGRLDPLFGRWRPKRGRPRPASRAVNRAAPAAATPMTFLYFGRALLVTVGRRFERRFVNAAAYVSFVELTSRYQSS